MNQVRLFVVESPSQEDLKQGVHDGKAVCEAAKLAGLNAQFFQPQTKAEFSKAVDDIRSQCSPSLVPFLHLSLHGNEKGIGLTDGTFVDWPSLASEIRPLNTASGGHLFVVMSACEGFTGMQMAIHPGDMPFFVLFGPTKKPTWSAAFVGFSVLYHRMNEGRFSTPNDLTDAVEAAGRAVADDASLFAWASGPRTRSEYENVKKQLLAAEAGDKGGLHALLAAMMMGSK